MKFRVGVNTDSWYTLLRHRWGAPGGGAGNITLPCVCKKEKSNEGSREQIDMLHRSWCDSPDLCIALQNSEVSGTFCSLMTQKGHLRTQNDAVSNLIKYDM